MALFVLLAAMVILAGCASHDAIVKKDAKELYDNGMAAYIDLRYDEAEKDFRALMEDHPLSPYSVDAQLLLGDIAYAGEKYDEASAYYTNFVAFHPTHPRAAYAQFQKGMSHFRDVLSVDRDQAATKKSLFAFEDLVKNYPGSQYHEKAVGLISFLKKRLAEKELYVAHFYFNSKNYKGALMRFSIVLKDYPDSGLSDETLYYIGETYSRLGEEKLAQDAYATLLANYPESPYVKDAKDRLKGS